MKNFKSHFWYNNSQRNGIFFLALLIIGLQLIFFFVNFSEKDTTDLDNPEILEFQQEIDSLKQITLENTKIKIFPFNPSFLTDFKGYQLGLSTEEIDRLLSHRAKGNYINSTKEFQQITKVSDSLLAAISPYFKFPDWVTNKKHNTIKNSSIPIKTDFIEEHQKTDPDIHHLNSATAKDLQTINGIGEKLSERIIKYRKKLGGFLLDEQLYEVYYLDAEIATKVLERFKVIEKPIIIKININTATFKEVLSVVYIDYELTKKIFEYRDEVAEIQSLEELKKIDGFPLDKFNRIALYLDAK
ncbi:MAG TPA: hypothetical protein DDZ39_07185 [Flavobacteriaceae bacterium]|nr:hypothetical protein [Flavobacteriaceae bacterium]